MRIVAATFPDRRAFDAREELRRRHRLSERDIGVRRLGTTDYAVLPTELLLAGRFEAGQLADAVEVIERHGGAVMVNREELTFERPAQEREPLDEAGPGDGTRLADGNPRELPGSSSRIRRGGDRRTGDSTSRRPTDDARSESRSAVPASRRGYRLDQ